MLNQNLLKECECKKTVTSKMCFKCDFTYHTVGVL